MLRETMRSLKCYAGGQAYCLDIEQVLALERGGRMLANPAPSGPSGWIGRWGKKIPVYGLAERLGSGPRVGAAGVILVMDQSKPWGLAVERVSRYEAPSRPLPVPVSIRDPRAAWFGGVIVDAGLPILQLVPEMLRPDSAPLPAAPVEVPAPAPPIPGPVAGRGLGRLLLFSPQNRVPIGQGATPADRTRYMFGLSYTQVVEIVSGIEHTQVPSAASHVLGLIAWRGRPVTVVDAGGLLGFEPLAVRPKGRLLITHSPLWQAPVAIPIGEEMQTRTLPLVHRSCLPALPLDLSYARGVFEIGRNEVLIVPNLDAIACPPGHRVV